MSWAVEPNKPKQRCWKMLKCCRDMIIPTNNLFHIWVMWSTMWSTVDVEILVQYGNVMQSLEPDPRFWFYWSSLSESWFLGLITNSSKTDVLGLSSESATVPECQCLTSWKFLPPRLLKVNSRRSWNQQYDARSFHVGEEFGFVMEMLLSMMWDEKHLRLSMILMSFHT